MTNELAVFATSTETLPSAALTDGALGNENLSADDLSVPTLKFINALNPEVDKGLAKAGDIYNTATQEAASSLLCVNLHYVRQYAAFRKRDFGQGFFGAAPTVDAARKLCTDAGEDVERCDIVETQVHTLGLIEVVDGTPILKGAARLFLKSTGLAVGQAWNTAIMSKNDNAPRFTSVWNLTSEKRKNQKGTWYVPAFAHVGYVDDGLYAKLKDLYLQLDNATIEYEGA